MAITKVSNGDFYSDEIGQHFGSEAEAKYHEAKRKAQYVTETPAQKALAKLSTADFRAYAEAMQIQVDLHQGQQAANESQLEFCRLNPHIARPGSQHGFNNMRSIGIWLDLQNLAYTEDNLVAAANALLESGKLDIDLNLQPAVPTQTSDDSLDRFAIERPQWKGRK